MKPLSAGQEGSSERKQQHRPSLGSALSNGLERLKTVTTSSVQPVAPASHPDKTDPKLKVGACPEWGCAKPALGVLLAQGQELLWGRQSGVLWGVWGSRTLLALPPFCRGSVVSAPPHPIVLPLPALVWGLIVQRVSESLLVETWNGLGREGP